MTDRDARHTLKPLALVVLFVLCLWLVMGQRITLEASTGGRGRIALLEPVLLLGSILVWISGASLRGAMVPRGIYWRSAGPLFTLLLALPILGAFRATFDLRSLYAIMLVAVPWSIFRLAPQVPNPTVWIRVAAIAIGLQGGYAVLQYLAKNSHMPAGAVELISRWDLNSQAAYAENYIISQRSTGLFINPNVFGQWSVNALIFSIFFLRGRMKYSGVALSLFGIYASQSRTAVTALFAAAIAMGLSGGRASRVIRMATGTVLIIALVMLLSQLELLNDFVDEDAVSRFTTGWQALTGSGTDPNLLGRVETWRLTESVADDYWMGTWGPPQVLFGHSIDNQYLGLYLQGGIPLLLAFLMFLTSPFYLFDREVRKPFIAFGVALAVMSAAAPAFENMWSMALVWIAFILVSARSETGTHAPQHTWSWTDTAKEVSREAH